MAEFVSDPEERRWIEPGSRTCSGSTRLRRPRELFAAWRTFFERVAEQGTIVMVFEDLQWADPGLLDFIESILEWSRNHPILIVTMARPELADKRPNWGSGRSFTAMHLERLPDALIAELVEDSSTACRRRASRRSSRAPRGCRSTPWRPSGCWPTAARSKRDDAYVLVGEVGTLDIPETLHALIAARLDVLARDRALMQDASVVGMTFTVEGLVAVAGLDREQVEARSRARPEEFLELEVDPLAGATSTRSCRR